MWVRLITPIWLGEGQTVEWMVHPGYVGPTGDDFNRATDREHELQNLMSPWLRDYLSDLKFELCTWDSLLSWEFEPTFEWRCSWGVLNNTHKYGLTLKGLFTIFEFISQACLALLLVFAVVAKLLLWCWTRLGSSRGSGGEGICSRLEDSFSFHQFLGWDVAGFGSRTFSPVKPNY